MTINSIKGESLYSCITAVIEDNAPALYKQAEKNLKKYIEDPDTLIKSLKVIGIKAKKKRVKIHKVKFEGRDVIALLNDGGYCLIRAVSEYFVDIIYSDSRKKIHKMELEIFNREFYSGKILMIKKFPYGVEEIIVEEGDSEESILRIESIYSCISNVIKEKNPKAHQYIKSQLARYEDNGKGVFGGALRFFGLKREGDFNAAKDLDILKKRLELVGLEVDFKKVEIRDATTKNHKVIALINNGDCCLIKSVTKASVNIADSSSPDIFQKISLDEFNEGFYSGYVLLIKNIRNIDQPKKEEERVFLKSGSIDSCIADIVANENPKLSKYTTKQLNKYSDRGVDFLAKILESVGFEAKVKKVDIENIVSGDSYIIALLKDGGGCLVKLASDNILEIICPKSQKIIQEVELSKFRSDFYSGKVLMIKNVKGDEGHKNVKDILSGDSLDSCLMGLIKDENKELYKYIDGKLSDSAARNPDSLVDMLESFGVKVVEKSVPIQGCDYDDHNMIAKLKNGNYYLIKNVNKGLVEIVHPISNKVDQKIELEYFDKNIYSGNVLVVQGLEGDSWSQKAHEISFEGDSLDSCIMSVILEENPQLYKYINAQLRKYATEDPDSLSQILKLIGLKTKNKIVSIHKAQAKYHDIIAVLNNGNHCLIKSIDDGLVEIMDPETRKVICKIELDKFIDEYYAGEVLLIKNPKGQKETTKVPRYSWFWGVIKDYRGFYTNVLVAAFMINVFSLVVPLFSMNVYDRVIPNFSTETLWALASGVILIIVFDFILKMLRSYFVENTGKKIDLKLSNIIFAKSLHLLMKDQTTPVGIRASRLKEFDSVRDFLSSVTLVGIIDFPFLIITMLVIYYIGGVLAFIPLIALLIAISVTILVNKPLDKYTEQSIKGAAQKNTLLFETLFNIETVKNLCVQPTVMNRWDEETKETSKAVSKLRFFSTLIVNCVSDLGLISSVSVVIIGTHLIWSSDLTIGGLIACSILTGRCLAPVAQITTIITRFKQVKCSLSSLDEMMFMEDERKGIKEFYSLDKMGMDIEFNDVSFAYAGQEIEFFKRLSLSIKEGEKVAILGNSGSGKTTLFKLMSGLYIPNEGSISISGVNIEQIDPYILRSNIGYVEQSSRLFSGTLWSNITMKNPKASQEEVLKVIQMSGIDSFAKKHPDGYNMRIEEGGSSLSGGQIQSVCLARSLLSDPNILLLDEPTNFMDTNLENNFIEQMRKFAKNKTMILSTHKKSLLTLVDRIIVIDDGKIVADNKKSSIIKKVA